MTTRASDGTGRIGILTVDQDYAKISDVKIYLDGSLQGRTDANGALVIRDIAVGEHTVKAHKEGFHPLQKTVTVVAGKTVSMLFQLEKIRLGRLDIQVLDRKQHPISGANVRLDGEKKGTTDADGALVIKKVRPGSHVVAVGKLGYRKAKRDVEVQPDATTSLDFQLEPGSIRVPQAIDTLPGAIDRAPPGATVLVAEGRYPTKVELDVDNLTVKSAGSPAETVIAPQSGRPGIGITADGVTVQGVTVARTGGGIAVGNAQDAVIKDCLIRDIGQPAKELIYGIYVGESRDVKVDDNVVKAVQAESSNRYIDGILVEQSSGVSVTDNTVRDVGRPRSTSEGIVFYHGTTDSAIKNNKIHDVGDNGIILDQADGTSIRANTVYDNDYRSLLLLAAQNNTIAGNEFYGNKHHGVELGEGSDRNVLEDNQVHDNQGNGVALKSASDNQIRGGTVRANKVGVFVFGESRANTIEGSEIADNKEPGLVVADSARVTVKEATVADNGHDGIAVADQARIKVIDSRLLRNKSGIAFQDAAQGTLRNNRLAFNHDWGLFTAKPYKAELEGCGNNFFANSEGKAAGAPADVVSQLEMPCPAGD